LDISSITGSLGGLGFGIGFVVVVFTVVLGLAAATWASRYHRAGPDEVLVISGRRYRRANGPEVGYKVVRSGGAFVMPIVEQYQKMSLHVISTVVQTSNAITKEGVPLTVEGTALFKISSSDEGIIAAAERYLGRPRQEIEHDVKAVLEGHLRGVCGQLTPEQIYQDRTAFQNQIAEQAQGELDRMGITLDTLTLRDISDDNGYLRALGAKRTAEVKRDARIGTAEAEREAAIREAAAAQESATARAQAETKIAEATKERDVSSAQFDAETRSQQAKIEQVAKQSEVEAEQSVIDAQAELATRDGRRRRQELEATVVANSEAEATIAIINAEAIANAQIKTAEGSAHVQEMNAAAAAKARLITARAEGDAASVKADGEADAISKRAAAEASAIRATGEAEAAATLAKLQAEAAGLRERASALKEFNSEAIRVELSTSLIDRLPEVVAAAAAPIASVNKITLTDFGGNGEDGGAIGGLLGVTPRSLQATDQVLRDTLGLGLTEMIGLVRSGDVPESTQGLID